MPRLLSTFALGVGDLDPEALQGGLLGEGDPLGLGLAGRDPGDLVDPRIGEAPDVAIAGEGEVIEGPGDLERVVGSGPFPSEELVCVSPYRREPQRVAEKPALVEGAQGLDELELKLVRDPVRAKEVLVDPLWGEQIGSRKGVTASELDGIGKAGRRGHGLLRKAETATRGKHRQQTTRRPERLPAG